MIGEIIKVSTVNREVYEQLKCQIIVGDIPPGKQITIREIASKYGVSTMPVREAIRRLQAEGFLQFENRCVTVRELTLEELQQIFVIRQRLESLAMEWALPNINEVDVRKLRGILKNLDQENISYSEWMQLNRQFHLSIYKLSMSMPLQQLIVNVWDSITPYMYIYTSSVISYEFSQKQHYLMLKLIEENNRQELISQLKEHLDDTCRTIMANLQSS